MRETSPSCALLLGPGDSGCCFALSVDDRGRRTALEQPRTLKPKELDPSLLRLGTRMLKKTWAHTALPRSLFEDLVFIEIGVDSVLAAPRSPIPPSFALLVFLRP